MRILLINPPHPSIGSRLPGEHLPPLGLLSIGGPLLDQGYEVKLLDAEFGPMAIGEIAAETSKYQPALVLLGHSGSTSAQPVISTLTKQIRQQNPSIKIVIGGVFPTYHWHEILETEPQIDYIVCGEGEETIVTLVRAIENEFPLELIRGIALRSGGRVIKTPPVPHIKDLNAYRVGWELMGDYHYTYWGKRKAVVIQFSRGCPHSCSYCGQRLFWGTWRHRDPQLLADEIEMLHEKYGVEVINFADENPSANQKEWIKFLNALIRKNLKLVLVGSIRADTIVRDAGYLHLYKKAGFERFLLGIENYDESVLEKIKKGGSIAKDRQAIQLLRMNNILSMATYVVGFGEETFRSFYNGLRQLLLYDPDQIQLLYVTPHQWTPFFEEIKDRRILQPDQSKWDYKHQVLTMEHLEPWKVILAVKLIELIMQIRPSALRRLFFHQDTRLRNAMRWYTDIGRKVWFYELFQFFFKDRVRSTGMKLAEFWQTTRPS
ncbi:MAG TPA: magnesium-protoporphyrin IX monomethyl ester anaerobic oxidative cyclase [Anaerolineales bacterium]|nr:magnesium-protoporphyrin IX monomethyl ester anaerobic oxidative cyclase [Anaerolineales bacterium]